LIHKPNHYSLISHYRHPTFPMLGPKTTSLSLRTNKDQGQGYHCLSEISTSISISTWRHVL